MRSWGEYLCMYVSTCVSVRLSVLAGASVCGPAPLLVCTCVYLHLHARLPVTRLPACKCCTCTDARQRPFLHMQHMLKRWQKCMCRHLRTGRKWL